MIPGPKKQSDFNHPCPSLPNLSDSKEAKQNEKAGILDTAGPPTAINRKIAQRRNGSTHSSSTSEAARSVLVAGAEDRAAHTRASS